MPGSGKTTLGQPLASNLGLEFVDTDQLLEVEQQAPLQTILEREGAMGLRALEGALGLRAALANRVIATGGSMVYSAAAMSRLHAQSLCIYLQAGLATLRSRLTNLKQRGFASPGKDLADVLAEREPLYVAYAHVVLPVDGLTQAEILCQLTYISTQALR